MSRLDQILDEAVDGKVAPFLVASVSDRNGVLWEGSAGEASSGHNAGPDTVFSLFSATKAIGSLMAIMAIDRGLMTMDTPVGDVLPRFDKIQVLEGMGPEGPIFRKPKRRATLRHLLTHTAGMGYEAFYPAMADYAAKTGSPSDMTGLLESLNYPMLFDPGEGFAYGVGTDWVGAVVSELDGRSIDTFVREEILEPLDMGHTYFERAEAGEQMADLVMKHPDGTFEPFEMYPAANPEIYHMGHALYSTAPDYAKFLRFVLNRGEVDGRRLVGPEAMELFFTDQLQGTPLPTPILKSSMPAISVDVEPCPGTRKSHTAAFFRNEDAVEGLRNVGSVTWAGVLNTHYWLDPEAGLATVFMTQMLPFCDPALMASYEAFERRVFSDFGR
jgi:CubicO group peptidase (beta-lactamase class C family)